MEYQDIDEEASKWSQVKDTSRSVCRALKKKVKKTKIGNVIPILGWGLKYDFRKALLGDVIAGVTLAIMQVLSSMADALLANVPFVLGLYCSVFPVFLYAIFGPSRHISVGTNSLICMLVGSTLVQHNEYLANYYKKHDAEGANATLLADSSDGPLDQIVTNHLNEILPSLVILVGLWQVVLAILQFGKFSWLFSDIAMSGYTAGAGIHLLVSQLKTILGIDLPRENGYDDKGELKVFKTLIDLFSKITETNFVTLGIFLGSVVVLVLNEEVVKPFLMRKIGVPVPMQFLLVLVGIPLSTYLEFHEKYDVAIAGVIPLGLPAPTLPDPDLMKVLIGDALVIAIVGYGFTLSMAKLIAKKYNYSLNGNQELFAEGASSVFGSFFQCLPTAASMSRSMTQATAGGTTQLTGIISSCIMIAVLLKIGYLLEDLPKCILAAVIVVAVKGVLLQILDFPGYFKKSMLDGLLWFGTFLGVVFTAIDKGLYVCIGLTIFVMVYRNYTISIVEMDDDDDDSDSDDSSSTTSSDGDVESVQCEATDNGKKLALRIIGVVSFANYEKVLKKCNKKLNRFRSQQKGKPVMIIDLTSVPYIDQTACKAFIEWVHSVDDFCHASLVIPEGDVFKMMRAHKYEEIQTFSSYNNAKSHMATSLATVLEDDVSVFQENGSDQLPAELARLSPKKLAALKQRRQSRLENIKALQATVEYMQSSLPNTGSLPRRPPYTAGNSLAGTPLGSRRGSLVAAGKTRRSSIMVVPPRGKTFRKREDSAVF